MPYCPDCGAEVAGTQSFCAECGASLNESTAGENGPVEAEPVASESGAPQMTSEVKPGPTDREVVTTTETELGVDENVAGALAYLLGIVSGIFFYLTESENRFVRFHAAQSIAFSVGVIVLYVLLGTVQSVLGSLFFGRPGVVVLIPAVVGLVAYLAWIGVFLLWLLLMVKAYNEERYELPIVGGIAGKYA